MCVHSTKVCSRSAWCGVVCVCGCVCVTFHYLFIVILILNFFLYILWFINFPCCWLNVKHMLLCNASNPITQWEITSILAHFSFHEIHSQWPWSVIEKVQLGFTGVPRNRVSGPDFCWSYTYVQDHVWATLAHLKNTYSTYGRKFMESVPRNSSTKLHLFFSFFFRLKQRTMPDRCYQTYIVSAGAIFDRLDHEQWTGKLQPSMRKFIWTDSLTLSSEVFHRLSSTVNLPRN